MVGGTGILTVCFWSARACSCFFEKILVGTALVAIRIRIRTGTTALGGISLRSTSPVPTEKNSGEGIRTPD
jgi:hypothetical protein